MDPPKEDDPKLEELGFTLIIFGDKPANPSVDIGPDGVVDAADKDEDDEDDEDEEQGKEVNNSISDCKASIVSLSSSMVSCRWD